MFVSGTRTCTCVRTSLPRLLRYNWCLNEQVVFVCSKWCDVNDITPSLSKGGHRKITCGGYTMRLIRTCANGNLAWRCSMMNLCPGRVHTDSDATTILKFVGSHNHMSKEEKRMRKEFAKKKKRGGVVVSEPGYIIDEDYNIKKDGVSTSMASAREFLKS